MKRTLCFILIPLFIFIISCNTIEKKADETSGNSIRERKSDSAKRPEVVALRFYNWYIKEMYPDSAVDKPQLKLTADSVYQLSDESQFARLKKTGFFSEEFFKKQKLLYQACNSWLKETGSKEIEDYQSAPNGQCDFLSYFPWLGGQGENITDVSVLFYNINSDNATVKMEIKADGIPYSHPIISARNESGLWKITDIRLEW